MWAFLALLVFCSAQAQQDSTVSSTVLHAWDVLDYDWEAVGMSRDEAVKTEAFIPSNNALTGVKSFNSSIYGTVPRWLTGVPSTLNKVVVDATGASVLQPYPDAWMNNLSNPDGLKYVQSMEVDTLGRMWILDVGRTNTYAVDPNNIVNGSAKLVLWDVVSNVELDRFIFPDDVAAPDGNFLNDIVVDQGRMFAFISDALRGSIVTVDLANRRASVFDDPSTKNDPTVDVTIAGIDYGTTTFTTPEDGIALTPDTEWVFFNALQSLTLHKVPASLLRQWPFDADATSAASAAVQVVGTKSSPADGMAFSAAGVLYSGGIADPDNNVWFYDYAQSQSGGGDGSASYSSFAETELAANARWADTFAFDGLGNLVWSENHLELFFTHTMNFQDPPEPNFSIKSAYIGSGSYMEGGAV
jgi:hypothetical protein